MSIESALRKAHTSESKTYDPDVMGWAPIKARGKTFWLTHHAADRAMEMGIPLNLLPQIIETGEWFDAPEHSKYVGGVYRNGKIAVAVAQRFDCLAITTFLWASVEAWQEADVKQGRERRDPQEVRRILYDWFGEAALTA